jgi:hypothetical protein
MMNYLIDLNSVEQEKPRGIEIGPNGMSIDLLRAVYRSQSIPLPVRLRAAIAALPHEVPRLSVVAQVNEQDFATLLDQRIKRMEARERTQTIEQVDVKPRLPRLGRFRRM